MTPGIRRSMGWKAIFVVTLLATSSWAAEKVIHNFYQANSDGRYPNSSLTFDSAGNLYGTTLVGGTTRDVKCGSGYLGGCGTVFEITP